MRNLYVYKKQTLLANNDELIKLVTIYLVWSKLDLAFGYFNIRVKESSKTWKTVLTTHEKMRTRIMSQVNCNSPGTMMEAILDIFKNIVYQCVVIYVDDIIFYSTKYEEHVRDLKKVLQRLEEQKFHVKKSKCQFFTGK